MKRLAVGKSQTQDTSVLCHCATTARQPPTPTILYMYCTDGTECLSHTPGRHCRRLYKGWWLSGCRGSVAEHWLLKPEVSWVQLPTTASLFHFLLQFMYFQHEKRCSEQGHSNLTDSHAQTMQNEMLESDYRGKAH